MPQFQQCLCSPIFVRTWLAEIVHWLHVPWKMRKICEFATNKCSGLGIEKLIQLSSELELLVLESLMWWWACRLDDGSRDGS